MRDEIQSAVTQWRRGKTNWAGPTMEQIVAKLAEECGEVARAVIGILEGREGRGDPVQEAAQVIIVLLTLVGIHFPDRDLFDELLIEMKRVGI